MTVIGRALHPTQSTYTHLAARDNYDCPLTPERDSHISLLFCRTQRKRPNPGNTAEHPRSQQQMALLCVSDFGCGPESLHNATTRAMWRKALASSIAWYCLMG